MIDFAPLELWFVTGSQHLYGPDLLARVAADAAHIVAGLNESAGVPVRLVQKPVLTTEGAITALCKDADASPRCIGLVAWMHTFSPARMWLAGLAGLQRPLCHLHTQFARDIPWSSLDMDYMNLHQSAHGGREFGYACSRLRKNRRVVVGHWEDPVVQATLGGWARAAAARHDAQGMKVARFGDNMRDVAVTEGDKVEAQLRFGYSVNGYGLGDLGRYLEAFGDAAIDELCAEYEQEYRLAAALRTGGAAREGLREAARIELALRAFLAEGGFAAFTDTFENLHGLAQVPGLPVQRLMADGYGFGAEGDWKHAALVRSLKVMGHGLPGGASFMEDYTYHFEPGAQKVLGAHMLEVCPSIAGARPSCAVHPLGIGGKDDPVRLVFDARPGRAVNASVVDLGDRFRMVGNAVEVLAPEEPLPELPVARAVWAPEPGLDTAAAAWIQAGGAHHTAFSQAVTLDWLGDFAEMVGIEFLRIDADTRLPAFKNELRWNEAYYG